MITGGSSGIGREFAKTLCQLNFNIYIISHDQQANFDTERELKILNPNILTESLYLDICDPNFYINLTKIPDYEFRMLINSAAVSNFSAHRYKKLNSIEELKNQFLLENQSYQEVFNCF